MSNHRHETYDQYSDDIRHAMRLANREAKLSFCLTISTSHLVIGMLSEPTGLAGHLLRQGCSNIRGVRRALRRVNRFGGRITFFGKLPLAEETHAIIDRAVEYAESNDQPAVGSGAVLLAVLQDDEIAAALLSSFGYDVTKLIEVLPIYIQRLALCAPDESIQLDL